MSTSLTFGAWKQLLQNDCIAQDKELAFNAIGDPVLQVLYDSGLDPTVDAIIASLR